jgi:hypothetical protein
MCRVFFVDQICHAQRANSLLIKDARVARDHVPLDVKHRSIQKRVSKEFTSQGFLVGTTLLMSQRTGSLACLLRAWDFTLT